MTHGRINRAELYQVGDDTKHSQVGVIMSMHIQPMICLKYVKEIYIDGQKNRYKI